MGQVRPLPIAVANVFGSALLIASGLRSSGRPAPVAKMIARDMARLAAVARAGLAWDTAALATIAAVAGAWLVTVIAYYPPRGIDDVTYHLPPVYEAIQRGVWVLLPVELRGHFAYPLNGEVLFLWTALFTGATRGGSTRHRR
jgi:hypothetical protein